MFHCRFNAFKRKAAAVDSDASKDSRSYKNQLKYLLDGADIILCTLNCNESRLLDEHLTTVSVLLLLQSFCAKSHTVVSANIYIVLLNLA